MRSRHAFHALLALAAAHGASAQVLHDNGPLVTAQGNGVGGADTSSVQTGSNETVTGYAASVIGATRVADDFSVPPTGWLVSGVRVFGFQPGARPTVLGIGQVRVRVWDGVPDAPGSTLLFDSAARGITPVIASANAYRVVGFRSQDARRPIARIDVTAQSLVLRGGTHWIDWQFTGARDAGPFTPPVTRAAQAGSGNALQFRGDAWSAIDGVGAGEELPFVILGGPLPNRIFADEFES